MKNQPFLTIGIASYNYSQYLGEAFEAIKRQKFTDYEILYCDDGSTDDSVDVINGFIKQNPDMRIRLVQGKNLGVMGNKNRIIENAWGKYLMLCDADDKMLDDCLSQLCGIALRTNADQVVGAFQQSDENGKVIQIQEIPENLSRWTWGAHHATLYKMEVILNNNIRFKKNCYPDDMYFNMIFHDNSKKTEFVNKVVYDWNMHADSTSATKVGEDKWHGYSMLESSLSYITAIAKKYTGDEYRQIEYAAIKMYCLANLYRYGGNLRYFLDTYKEMHKLMRQNFPDYEKNEYAKEMNAKQIVRKPTARSIWLFLTAERTHTINVVLSLYWLVSKFKKFTV